MQISCIHTLKIAFATTMNFDTKAQLKPFPDFNCLSTVYYEKPKTGNAQNIKRF